MRFSVRPAVFLLSLITCLTINSRLYGQDWFVLEESQHTYRLDTHVSVLVDSTNKLTFEEVLSTNAIKFRPSERNLTFGYLKSSIWLRVDLRTLNPRAEWFLEIPAPYLEYVDFYQNEDGEWKHYESGYYRSHSVRVIAHTGHVIPLKFGADSTSQVYIRIAGLSPKTFPLFAKEKQAFYDSVRFEDVGYGIFYGILIVMFFYNLLLFITLKQSNYFLYICTIVCTFLIFASASGYGGKFLWPTHPTMNYYAGRLSLPVLICFLSYFTIRFLEVEKYSKVLLRILQGLMVLSVIATFLIVTKILPSAGNNLISLSTVIYITSGIVCYVRGNKTAKYFIAAWTVYFVGGLLLTLRNSGVFDFNFWTTHFVEIGAALETTIIAFALGDRYRRYKQEKEEIQLLALKVQQETTEKLERSVQERTEQLSRANEELRHMLETNTHQTRVIENKNAELDAFFYRISHDLKGPISSLLGLSILAKRDLKDEQALVYVDRQQAQVERLNHIIVGLINLTQLNHKDLHKVRIDFDKMIDDCINSFSSHEHFKRVEFRKDIQPGLDFHSEWTLLNAVLQNLIENAIKYSRQEDAYVRVLVRREMDMLILRVQDNGQGIRKEHQHKIFEMFFRASQNANGSGLGLYILKRSVDRLKGTIEIESEFGVGSVFTVKLPVE